MSRGVVMFLFCLQNNLLLLQDLFSTWAKSVLFLRSNKCYESHSSHVLKTFTSRVSQKGTKLRMKQKANISPTLVKIIEVFVRGHMCPSKTAGTMHLQRFGHFLQFGFVPSIERKDGWPSGISHRLCRDFFWRRESCFGMCWSYSCLASCPNSPQSFAWGNKNDQIMRRDIIKRYSPNLTKVWTIGVAILFCCLSVSSHALSAWTPLGAHLYDLLQRRPADEMRLTTLGAKDALRWCHVVECGRISKLPLQSVWVGWLSAIQVKESSTLLNPLFSSLECNLTQ